MRFFTVWTGNACSRQNGAEAVSAGSATDVMVNTINRQVHPKTEGVDFENAEKMCMGYVAIVVDDYNLAIEYYTNKLGFILVEDTPQPGKRWVVVTPNLESDCNLLLARA